MSRPKSTSPKASKPRKGSKAVSTTAPADLETARQAKLSPELRALAKLPPRLRKGGRKPKAETIIVPPADVTIGTEQNPATLTAAGPVETVPPAQPEQAPVGPAHCIALTAQELAPFLAIAPTKDVRYYMNSVYIHKVGPDLRIVATDGHRMLVQSIKHDGDLSWGEKGIILPVERLARICKYVGKSDETITIAYGENWPAVQLSVALASFEVKPVDSTYPQYGKVLESVGDVFANEVDPLETSAIDPKYLKAAGHVAGLLEAKGVFCFTGKTDGHLAFTFAGVEGVLLVVMGLKQSEPSLKGSVAKLIGDKGMSRTLAALKAHETRNAKAAKEAKTDAERARLTTAAGQFAERIAQIMAGLSPQLEHKTDTPAAKG